MNSDSVLTKEFVEWVLAVAKKNLETDGFLVPVLFIKLANGETDIIPLELPNTPDEKQAYFQALSKTLRQSGKVVQEALMLSESWFVQAKKPSDAGSIRPSQHPARKEAITAVGRNHDCSRYTTVVQPVARSKGKLSWEPPAISLYNAPSEKASFPVGLLDFLFTSA